MKHTEFRTLVGARGWQRPEWEGSYYPDGMPPEWRLAYYANDFTGVLVPAESWRCATSETLVAWVEEVPEGFLFLLEAAPLAAEAGDCARSLGTAFGGWVGADGDEAIRTATLGTAIEGGAPVVVLLQAADLVDRRALGRRLTELGRRRPPPRALIVTDAVDGQTLRELRLLAELVGIA